MFCFKYTYLHEELWLFCKLADLSFYWKKLFDWMKMFYLVRLVEACRTLRAETSGGLCRSRHPFGKILVAMKLSLQINDDEKYFKLYVFLVFGLLVDKNVHEYGFVYSLNFIRLSLKLFLFRRSGLVDPKLSSSWSQARYLLWPQT